MVDESDSTDPILAAKRPAPVAPAGSARRPAKKKAPAKKAGAKKKAPAKKPAPKKAAPRKKAPAKKAAPKKAAPKKAPAARADSPRSMPTDRPTPIRPTPAEEPRRSDESTERSRWALCASITQELLNDIVLMLIGEGVALEPLETSVAMPGMGEVDVRLALTVNGGHLDLRAGDGGRARVVVTALGDVSARASAYTGEVVDENALGMPMGLPNPPAPIPVRVEALVHPVVEVHSDHRVTLGLDLSHAELVSLEADREAPVPDGVDAGAWSGILQMFGMVFGMLGESLFASLGEHVGSVGTELSADLGAALVELGVDPGRAEVSVSSGLLSFGLVATDAVRGRAQPVPVAGKRVGIGMASSVVDHLSQKLLAHAAGELPLPFELDVDLGEQRVGGRVRQTRVLPETFPDLRSSLRTEVRPRLLRGRLELSIQSAWVELPSVVPSIFNQVSKRLGELVSLAPVRVRFPARLEVPLIPGTGDTVPVEIDDLRITTNGLGVVVALV